MPKPKASDGNPAIEPPDYRQTQYMMIALADLVLHPDLQCREEGLNAEIVSEYKAAYKNDDMFPPLHVIAIDGALHLVDGWHRVAAATEAGRTHHSARVEPGTWQDALVAAARANPNHGLRRTVADKNKAMRLLLSDETFAALSSRKLADLARVSHTFVDQVRSRYGLKVGEVLTPEVRARQDGLPTPVWAALLAETPEGWRRKRVDGVRGLTTIQNLARTMHTYHHDTEDEHFRRALAIRLEEFGRAPWVWAGETDEERLEVVARLDTEAELVEALSFAGCPEPMKLLEVLADMHYLQGNLTNRPSAVLRERWERRPALLEALERVEAADREAKEGEEWYQLQQVYNAREDDQRQTDLVRALPEGAAMRVNEATLGATAREDYRTLMAERLGQDLPMCEDPGCDGWVREGRCTLCRCTPDAAREANAKALARARLLGGTMGDSDPKDTTLLLAMRQEFEVNPDPAWLKKVPAPVREAFRAWWSPCAA